ncbi:MAG: hypothetical protein FJ102_01120 [Deltaproteobacteria bacterium]|nr:hypothetical protein [Deltaproteobacteria bacterium]
MTTPSDYLRLGPDELGTDDLLHLVAGRHAARKLIEAYGDARSVSRQSAAALANVAGCGVTTAARIHAGFELARRLHRHQARPHVARAHDVVDWFGPRIGNLPHEELHALYLCSRGRVLRSGLVTRGSAEHTIFDVAGLVGEALRTGSKSLVVAHNHPSGDPEPSADDLSVTHRLCQVAEIAGIRVLDHVVLAGDAWSSMASRGQLPAAHGLARGPWVTP